MMASIHSCSGCNCLPTSCPTAGSRVNIYDDTFNAAATADQRRGSRNNPERQRCLGHSDGELSYVGPRRTYNRAEGVSSNDRRVGLVRSASVGSLRLRRPTAANFCHKNTVPVLARSYALPNQLSYHSRNHEGSVSERTICDEHDACPFSSCENGFLEGPTSRLAQSSSQQSQDGDVDAETERSDESEEPWSARHSLLLMIAFIGLNAVLLTVRLLIVCVSLQYLVHSVVIFFDLLIVCVSFHGVGFRSLAFVPSFALAGLFAWEQLIVFEIMETTLLALVATIKQTHHRVFVHRAFGHVPKRHSALKTIALELFDGSSGVLYTSFFGLILVESFRIADIGREELFCIIPSSDNS